MKDDLRTSPEAGFDLTPRAQEVMDAARALATRLNRPYVSSEMLQLAVLDVKASTLAHILDDLGVLADVRQILLEMAASPSLEPVSNTARDQQGRLLGYFVSTPEGHRLVDFVGHEVTKDANGNYRPLGPVEAAGDS